LLLEPSRPVTAGRHQVSPASRDSVPCRVLAANVAYAGNSGLHMTSTYAAALDSDARRGDCSCVGGSIAAAAAAFHSVRGLVRQRARRHHLEVCVCVTRSPVCVRVRTKCYNNITPSGPGTSKCTVPLAPFDACAESLTWPSSGRVVCVCVCVCICGAVLFPCMANPCPTYQRE
jgi:hypothetical protein